MRSLIHTKVAPTFLLHVSTVDEAWDDDGIFANPSNPTFKTGCSYFAGHLLLLKAIQRLSFSAALPDHHSLIYIQVSMHEAMSCSWGEETQDTGLSSGYTEEQW